LDGSVAVDFFQFFTFAGFTPGFDIDGGFNGVALWARVNAAFKSLKPSASEIAGRQAANMRL